LATQSHPRASYTPSISARISWVAGSLPSRSRLGWLAVTRARRRRRLGEHPQCRPAARAELVKLGILKLSGAVPHLVREPAAAIGPRYSRAPLIQSSLNGPIARSSRASPAFQDTTTRRRIAWRRSRQSIWPAPGRARNLLWFEAEIALGPEMVVLDIAVLILPSGTVVRRQIRSTRARPPFPGCFLSSSSRPGRWLSGPATLANNYCAVSPLASLPPPISLRLRCGALRRSALSMAARRPSSISIESPPAAVSRGGASACRRLRDCR